MPEEKLLSTGAESKIFLQENFVIKRRIKKSYRIPEIDEKLRKLRTRAESKIMSKLAGKINTPKILKVNEQEKEIVMQFIKGKKLSEHLDNFPLSRQEEICQEIGKEVGKIHDENIIHSDLTTSNMILQENLIKNKNKYNKVKKETNNHASKIVSNLTTNSELRKNFKVFFIDFGLSFHSARIEDKAVDLHLLRQALESKHFKNWEKLFKAVLSGYQVKDREKILRQLEKVEKRGRYRKNAN